MICCCKTFAFKYNKTQVFAPVVHSKVVILFFESFLVWSHLIEKINFILLYFLAYVWALHVSMALTKCTIGWSMFYTFCMFLLYSQTRLEATLNLNIKCVLWLRNDQKYSE